MQELTMVEVAGIEPASEGLQRAKTTCVSDPLSFASVTYEPAGAHARYPLNFGQNSGELSPDLSRCVTPRPVFTGKNGET